MICMTMVALVSKVLDFQRDGQTLLLVLATCLVVIGVGVGGTAFLALARGERVKA